MAAGWQPPFLAKRSSRHRLLLALVDGVVAGVLIGFVAMLVNPHGEPTVQPSLPDRMIWFAVLGSMGAVNALALYLLSALAVRLVRQGRG